MTIGEVIRKYRREIGLTQEEMANRLGVTTPAVNKWENNNTQPDIGLLAPMARLLGISTDTLLSFKDELTEEEVNMFIKALDKKSDTIPYAELFQEAGDKIREYPNCEKLKWNAATMLDAWKVAYHISDDAAYDEQICEWYSDLLDSEDPIIRKQAAESLFYFYYRKECYEKAGSYLTYLPYDDPDRRSRQADIFSKTGRKEEAYHEYEELMLMHLNHLRIVLNALQVMYLEDKNTEMVHKLVNIQGGLAKLFDLGTYQEVAMGLELAVYEKDIQMTERIMRGIIENSDTLTDFMRSDLFSHIPMRTADNSFMDKLRSDLIKSFQDEESYGYMRGNEFWESLKDM